jgi:hypothetical protein
LPEV